MKLNTKKKQKQSIPVWIFVVASISALIFILPLITYFSLLFEPSNPPFVLTTELAKSTEIISDPLITKASDSIFKLSGPIISSEDPIYGDKQAKVKIVVFSDYNCEYCKNQIEMLKNTIDRFQGKVFLTWKDYPSEEKNSASYRSAIAGRCAQKQNDFWGLNNFLYKKLLVIDENTVLGDNLLADWAMEEGLDRVAFIECLKDGEAENLVKLNIEEAKSLDIIGVPFMYVNNQEFVGEISQEDLNNAINVELNK